MKENILSHLLIYNGTPRSIFSIKLFLIAQTESTLMNAREKRPEIDNKTDRKIYRNNEERVTVILKH